MFSYSEEGNDQANIYTPREGVKQSDLEGRRDGRKGKNVVELTFLLPSFLLLPSPHSAILNRETRDALAPLEREHLHSTFRYVGLGLAITAASAYQLHRTGFSARIMTANPWVVLGGGVLLSVGSMYACFNTAPENTVQKLFFFTAFQVAQSIAIAPLLFLSPALLARAGLYTVGVVGSLAYVGATARQDKFLYIGGPVLAGIVVVALSSLAPMILPRTAVRTLAITESLALYGGLAVFSAAILMDVQKLLLHARQAAQGLVKLDPVGESIGIELHTLNIFVRMVQMLAMSQNRRK
ncbi:inhibitor of apoptosis-promoting Bax1-domain-containing protein [Mrakia frigida]|uniref:inhibitor of apoptosis-promoting Bax1-domain-containing protein n=1 Tax=Mrakia frigida TaxID=29902 RepID=UPI003FCC1E9E